MEEENVNYGQTDRSNDNESVGEDEGKRERERYFRDSTLSTRRKSDSNPSFDT